MCVCACLRNTATSRVSKGQYEYLVPRGRRDEEIHASDMGMTEACTYLEDVDGGVEQRRQRALADVDVRLDGQVLVPHLDLGELDPDPAHNKAAVNITAGEACTYVVVLYIY
jgi:hypothetical protein